jgi:cation diffusion facilitator CzcD-associated flavoprotein CzcO
MTPQFEVLTTNYTGFARKYDLEHYIKLKTYVKRTAWDEELAIWRITLQNQVTGDEIHDWAHVLINGTGILNTWTCTFAP